MKTPSIVGGSKFFAPWMVLTLTFLIAVSTSIQAAESSNKDDKGFLEKMAQWQQKMSEKFREAWSNFRSDKNDKSIAPVSVDLREDSHNYTVRLNLPERELAGVDIKLNGETLTIAAPAEGKVNRYEQTLALAGAGPDSEMKVDRRPKEKMIVITVPKNSTITAYKPSSPIPSPDLLPPSDWDRDIFERMEKMRKEMDKIFSEGFREFRDMPEHKNFFDERRFGSSLDLKEEGDNYVVRAYLPERDIQNVNVSVEGQTLKIEAKEEHSAKKDEKMGALRSTRKSAYSQLLSLPGPVEIAKMNVERKKDMLVVTIPKKK